MNKPKEVKKSDYVAIRVNDKEKELLRQEAEKRGMNMSSFVRFAVLNYLTAK